MAVPARAVVAPPGPGGCGDYATNVALQLARPAGRPPRHVAEILRPLITEAEGVARVEITGPGFLNITLDGGAEALVREILRRGVRYGYAEEPSGRIVQLHYPCEVRAAVSGQVLAGILRTQGALVRTSCEAEPDPAWAEPLGVTVDAHGRPGAPAPLEVNPRPVPAPEDRIPLDVNLRPVPAPEDPTPSAVTPPAGPFSIRPPTTGPGSPPTTSCSARPTPLQGPLRTRPRPSPQPQRRRPRLRRHPRRRTPTKPRPFLSRPPHGPGRPPRRPRHRSHPPRPRPPGPPPRRHRRRLPPVPGGHPRPPLGDEKPSAAHRARLALAEAAGTVLAGGLTLLGIDAPEHL